MNIEKPKSNKEIISTNEKLLSSYKETGDINIRNKIIVNNMGLVYDAAKKRVNIHTSFTFEDLVQEGTIGMIKSIERFDITRNTRFSTYAYYWINQQMDRAIMNNGYIIRLPAYLYEKINKLNRIEKLFLVDDTDLETIFTETDITEVEYHSIDYFRKNYCYFSSLNAVINIDNSDDKGIEFQDFVPSQNPSLEETIIKKNLREEIDNALNTLTPREKEVLELRFGLIDNKIRTLEEIGIKYGVTRERIRQIEVKALEKIRISKNIYGLKEFLNL